MDEEGPIVAKATRSKSCSASPRNCFMDVGFPETFDCHSSAVGRENVGLEYRLIAICPKADVGSIRMVGNG